MQDAFLHVDSGLENPNWQPTEAVYRTGQQYEAKQRLTREQSVQCIPSLRQIEIGTATGEQRVNIDRFTSTATENTSGPFLREAH